MTTQEYGQHYETLRPSLVKRARRKGLKLDEAEDVVQDATEDLLPKCFQYPDEPALSAAFNAAIEFGARRARRRWHQRATGQIEVRAQQGLTGSQTGAGATDSDRNNGQAVPDDDRVAYGYGQLSADERGAREAPIKARARQQIIDRAPTNVRPILERLTEGASFRDVAKELGISGAALRQRLSRYRRRILKMSVTNRPFRAIYSVGNSPL